MYKIYAIAIKGPKMGLKCKDDEIDMIHKPNLYFKNYRHIFLMVKNY